MHSDHVIPFSIEEIVTTTGGAVVQFRSDFFGDVVIDGRQVNGGALFVAIQGAKHDGHAFVAQAAAAGCTGVLVQKGRGQAIAHAHPALSVIEVLDTTAALGDLARTRRMNPAFGSALRVVGVTGSYGKTTTKNMLSAIFGGATTSSNVLANIGNLNNHYGVPLTLLRLQRQHQYAVIEMGMSGLGEIAYLASIARPAVGIITGVGPAHLEQLGSLENIAKAKAELFHGLPEGGLAVYPVGRAHRLLEREAEKAGACPGGRLRFAQVQVDGAPMPHAVQFQVLSQGIEGIDLQLAFPATKHRPQEECRVQIPLLGSHYALNAALAATAAREMGISLSAIQQGLSAVLSDKHRCQHVLGAGRHFLDDCYNANPESTRAAIATLIQLRQSGRAFVVLGDMLELGPEAGSLHREVGAFLATHPVDRLISVGNMAQQAAAEAARQGLSTLNVDTVNQAAHVLLSETRPGDWILLKGSRGMGLEQILAFFVDQKG